MSRPTLLLVDDEPTNLQVLRHTLQDDYRLLFAKDGEKALSLALKHRPDLVLLDVMMPGIDGYAVCKQLKQQPATALIPVIFITALDQEADEQHGFDIGAVDFINKPFRPAVLKARIKTHLQLSQAQAVKKSRLAIIYSLGRASEFRDNETGWHILRMSHYAQRIAQEMGYSKEDAELLLQASPLHDVGKIGIPDLILLKPSKLTAEEFKTMQQHTVIGAEIIGEHDDGFLKLAATIALTHHEKWNGQGYPNQLASTDIPKESRIVAVADVFDALTSHRPYKQAWPVEQAVELIQSESGEHFDPEVVAAFAQCLPDILKIRDEFQEP